MSMRANERIKRMPAGRYKRRRQGRKQKSGAEIGIEKQAKEFR